MDTRKTIRNTAAAGTGVATLIDTETGDFDRATSEKVVHTPIANNRPVVCDNHNDNADLMSQIREVIGSSMNQLRTELKNYVSERVNSVQMDRERIVDASPLVACGQPFRRPNLKDSDYVLNNRDYGGRECDREYDRAPQNVRTNARRSNDNEPERRREWRLRDAIDVVPRFDGKNLPFEQFVISCRTAAKFISPDLEADLVIGIISRLSGRALGSARSGQCTTVDQLIDLLANGLGAVKTLHQYYYMLGTSRMNKVKISSTMLRASAIYTI